MKGSNKNHKHQKLQKLQKQFGFSLIELMIALTIGIVLTLGVLQLMSITKRSYLLSTHLGALMNNADVAINTLSRCAQYAGRQSPYYTEGDMWNPVLTKLTLGCFTDSASNPQFAAPPIYYKTPGNVGSLAECVPIAADKGITTIGFSTFGSSYISGGSQYVCWGGNNPSGNNPTLDYTRTTCGCCNPNVNGIYFLRGSGTRYSGAPFSGTTGTSTGNDTLVISYEGQGTINVDAGQITDCQGNPVAKNILAVNTFQIQNDSAGNPYFGCSVASINITTGALQTPQPFQPIAYGVEGFRVLYGIDTDGDGAPNIYSPASFFATDPNGSMTDFFGNIASASSARVVGVEVALLLRTNDPISGAIDSKSYSLLNNTYGPYNDRRIRKLYTFALKTNECIPSIRTDCGRGTEFYAYYTNTSNTAANFSFAGYIRPGTNSTVDTSQAIMSPKQVDGSANIFCGCQMDSLFRLWAVGQMNNSFFVGATPVTYYQIHNPQSSMQTAAPKASVASISSSQKCICAFR